jgi:hypothetical protein
VLHNHLLNLADDLVHKLWPQPECPHKVARQHKRIVALAHRQQAHLTTEFSLWFAEKTLTEDTYFAVPADLNVQLEQD